MGSRGIIHKHKGNRRFREKKRAANACVRRPVKSSDLLPLHLLPPLNFKRGENFCVSGFLCLHTTLGTFGVGALTSHRTLTVECVPWMYAPLVGATNHLGVIAARASS